MSECYPKGESKSKLTFKNEIGTSLFLKVEEFSEKFHFLEKQMREWDNTDMSAILRFNAIIRENFGKNQSKGASRVPEYFCKIPSLKSVFIKIKKCH